MSSIYTNGNDSYFYSNKIKVFPCAYRSNAYDATARLNTEYNFTHLPHMADKASYIIEFTSKKLICAIQGYYFEIELGTDDYGALNNNKYLNICVASPKPPEGTDFIEGPHLCSWDSSDSVEATLDYKPEGSDYYIFKGLKIGERALSNGSYQCYALKLDASAMLPISASKIENSAGVPISNEFTTRTLSATTSISTPELSVASDKLTVNSENITANVPVTINNTLEVKDSTATTLILKAESERVTINKPTYITGTTEIKKSSSEATDGSLTVAGTGGFGDKLTVSSGGADITGDTQIKKSSSGATNGNLIVAGRGSFGGELSVTADIVTGTAFTVGKVQQQDSKQQDLGKLLCADVEVPLFVKNNLYVRGRNIDIGNTSSVPNITIYGIQPKSNDTSTFANGELLKIDQVTGKIAVYGLRKTASDDETDTVGEIFSIDPKTGITCAYKINAPVEGISADAENVKTSINGKSITDIFETNGLVVQKASCLTATSSTASAGNIIITGNTTGTVDALIPAKAKDRTYNIGSSDKTFDNIYATTFHGSLDGNASTATSATYANRFSSEAIVKLTGDITGESSSTKGWTIETTINDNAVTKTKIKNGEVTNDKLAGGITNNKLVYNSITIGSTEVGLGGSVGDHESRRIGTLYGTWLNLSGDMLVSNIGNIKVNNAGLKSSTTLQIVKSNNYDYVKIGNSSSTINSLLVNGLSEFTSRATFEAGISVTGSATFGNGISVTQDIATFGAGISVTGTAEATTFNASSDKRLKENIIDYKPEKSILDLPIKKFDFIDGPKNQIGCIAQDLKEICPEIVNENEKGYLSIQESKLVYLLLDEVKKLKNEVEKLKRK